MQGWQPALTGVGEPEPLVGEQVTHEYFDVLGVHAAVGRDFTAAEDVPGAPRVVVHRPRVVGAAVRRRSGRDRAHA